MEATVTLSAPGFESRPANAIVHIRPNGLRLNQVSYSQKMTYIQFEGYTKLRRL